MSRLKIGLIGCGGSGRSLMAHKISEALGIPFLSSNSITRPILQRDGYDSSEFVEFFLSMREQELVSRRIEEESKYPSFITDRTTLDHFAYLFLTIHKHPVEEVQELETKCKANLATFTHLFYFRRPASIVKNGIRTTDIGFQTMIDYIIRGLIDDWNVPVLRMHTFNSILTKVSR